MKHKEINLFDYEMSKNFGYHPVDDIQIKMKDIPQKTKDFYDTYAIEYDKEKLTLNPTSHNSLTILRLQTQKVLAWFNQI